MVHSEVYEVLHLWSYVSLYIYYIYTYHISYTSIYSILKTKNIIVILYIYIYT